MPAYDPTQPLIFIHVPKTGGKSTRAVFERWFGPDLLPHYFKPNGGGLPPRRDLAALTRAGQPPLIYGHFNRRRGFGVDQYYPEVRQMLTILREPLQMHMSRYFFAQRLAEVGHKIWGAPGDDSLATFIETGHLNMLEHFPRPVSADNYRDILEEFFLHIGFLDQLGPSLHRMGRILGQPTAALDIPHVNRSMRDQHAGAEQVARFRERHVVEYAVYEHARAMFADSPSLDVIGNGG